MAFDPQQIIALSDGATMRDVGEEAVILMVRSGQIYTCNPTARFFISQLDGRKTAGSVATEMAAQYDVDDETLLADLAELLTYLLDEGVLAKAG